MSTDFYARTFDVTPGNRVGSQVLENEFALLQTGLEKLPSLTQQWGGASNYAVAGGAVNVYTATVAATYLTSYTDGLSIIVKFGTANNNTTPTINLNSLGAKTIERADGTAVVAGELVGVCQLTYNITSGKFQLTAVSAVNMTAAAASAAAALASQNAAAASASTASTQATNSTTSATNSATSATGAGTSATSASNSATSATNSATSATASATTATTQATTATTQATNAATSATNAGASATTATTQATNSGTSATNAASSATAAATSATNASSSATSASSSATSASGSASTATTQATNAATSATGASGSATTATTQATNAAASYDAFDDRYLGAKATAPTLDNDGAALLAGAIYWDTVTPEMRVWNGTAWVAVQSLSSATTATTQATNAANSATSAANSATAAANSATSASGSASTATTQASNATTSATNASASAATATTQATNAATSATNAATSATNSANSATAAATSATNSANSATASANSATSASTSASTATTQAANSSASATAAATSATNAAASATAAATSATNAEAIYDSFDDRYLGAKTTAPTLDNDGAALLVGALYFNSTDSTLYSRSSGGTWISSTATTAGAVSNTPVGGIAAVNVQAALNELDADKTAHTDLFSDFVVGGLLSPTSADLISLLAAGTAYVTGLRTVKATESKAYTASKDTYVDMASTGVLTYVEVALAAAAPAVTPNNLRLQKVVTSATAITAVTRLAALVTTVAPGTTLVAPVLGVATLTSANKVTITAPATTATLTLVEGSTLVTAGAFSQTHRVTAPTDVTYPTAGTLATLAGTEVLTGKTVNLTSNTLVTTLAQLNAALSDADVRSNAELAGAGGAALIGNTPAGNIAATNVQAALNELDSDLTAGLATKQPIDPTLTALSGLSTGADQLPYSTGVDTFAQTPLTVFARSLLDDATAAAARTTLDIALDFTRNIFVKADTQSVAFTKTAAGTCSLKAGTYIDVAGTLLTFASATAIVMPVLTDGTDYAIYACTDGTVRADANFSAPSGYTTANSRKIGGFHYSPGGHSGVSGGGNATPQINEFSFWDLKFKPACQDPRGMALVADGFWADIYLTGVDHLINGSSKFNVTIADGSSPPKVPTKFGGNGTAAYTSLNWWEAGEVAAHHGKRLPSYAEFAALAYGTTEAVSIGADPVSTTWAAAYISKWGCAQVSGTMWQWGANFGGGAAGAAWAANTVGRGSTYQMENAVVFAGAWDETSVSGSRCSRWNLSPTHSLSGISGRGVCNLLILE